MATEYGNPKFKDSNKNLSFTMKGQPLDDALGRVVNTVSDENIDISNLEFSSNSDYSKTHNNSVNYDKVINSTSKTYRINWKLKSNVGTHPNKTTSLKYGLSSWFNGDIEGTSEEHPLPCTSGKYQLEGSNNFNPSRSLADLRYFNAKIKVNNLDGDPEKEVVFNTADPHKEDNTQDNIDNTQIKGVAQGYYNYDAPYTVFEASSSEKWASFQTLNGGTSNSISITSLSGDISHENNTHYLVIDDNSLSILYGDIIGNHTVHYNIDKDENGNSISNSYAGSVTFTSDNNGKAFVMTPTDKTNVTAPPRFAEITYSLTDYNTSSIHEPKEDDKLKGSFIIHQDKNDKSSSAKDPELTYSWSIKSGLEYVSSANYHNNTYIINVKDNSGTIGSITGTPSISSISNPKPLYKVGTFNISGLTMVPSVITSSRSIIVNTTVSGKYCNNFNVSNPSIDTTVIQSGSNWVPNPMVVGKLSIICENPQTDKIDQSHPASFKIKQLSSNEYSSSLSNVSLKGNIENNFNYQFGTIFASSTNIKVSGDITVGEPSGKSFESIGGNRNIPIYPKSLKFEPGYSKAIDDIRWKLKFTPNDIQNDKQYTNVKSSEITVTQTGIPEGTEKTYNPLTIIGKSSTNWLTVSNNCTFNYNDYTNYNQTNPFNMVLNAEPNRTSVNAITVTDTTSSNIYKLQITDASVTQNRKANITLSTSDLNTNLSTTTIEGFTQSGENINCNISLTYNDLNSVNNKYVNLINTTLNISDTEEHNLTIPISTTGHTNNYITSLITTKDGNNDKLTISTNDELTYLWWHSNPSTSVGLRINASGTNLGNYELSKKNITVNIPGDSNQTPSVKWYSKSEADGQWKEISNESSKLSISVSGNIPSAESTSTILSKRSNVSLTDKPFKLTRGKPTSAATIVYYKVESNTGGSAGTDNSVYVERTDSNDGFGSVSIISSSTNITITADSTMTVSDSDLKVAGSNPNTEYANWYVYGPNVTLGSNPAITTKDGLKKITGWKVGASKTGASVPETISAFAETKDKEFYLSASVNPSVTAGWEASISSNGLTSSDSGSFDTSKYGSDNIWANISYEWSTKETSSSITWKPDVHIDKKDYTESISCKVTVTFQDGKIISDTLIWETKILKTDVKFEGTLKCSNDMTITAFDPQIYNTSAMVNGYKVTATSGTLTSDWTKSYNYILNETSKPLTAIQGSDGSTKGEVSFEYTLKSPEVSNANVTTALDQKHTVHLYCYGKSYYNG